MKSLIRVTCGHWSGRVYCFKPDAAKQETVWHETDCGQIKYTGSNDFFETGCNLLLICLGFFEDGKGNKFNS